MLTTSASVAYGQTAKVDTTTYPGIYLAAGWGIPSGQRFELGHNCRWGFTYSLTVSSGDNWSSHPGESMLGCLFKMHLVSRDRLVRPYLLYADGGHFSIFGSSDHYRILGLGVAVPWGRSFRIRPEAGLAWTNRFVSGGWSFWGPSTPTVYDTNRKLCLTVMLEFNF
jgi:hypothetical protein